MLWLLKTALWICGWRYHDLEDAVPLMQIFGHINYHINTLWIGEVHHKPTSPTARWWLALFVFLHVSYQSFFWFLIRVVLCHWLKEVGHCYHLGPWILHSDNLIVSYSPFFRIYFEITVYSVMVTETLYSFPRFTVIMANSSVFRLEEYLLGLMTFHPK